jgi:hypothetical protein
MSGGKHVRPASSKEHFESKKKGCPCIEDPWWVRDYYACKATGGECKFEECPFYYWVFYVKK